MSRTLKVDVNSAFYRESGRVPVLRKAPVNAHSGECFLCDKGKRPKRALSQARRREDKMFLRREIKDWEKETLERD